MAKFQLGDFVAFEMEPDRIVGVVMKVDNNGEMIVHFKQPESYSRVNQSGFIKAEPGKPAKKIKASKKPKTVVVFDDPVEDITPTVTEKHDIKPITDPSDRFANIILED